jgi:hypothetical protein
VTVRVGMRLGSGGGGDTTPPTAVVVSPPVGTDIAPDEELVVDVTDDVALGYVTVFATWEGIRKPDLLYRGGAYQPDYTIASSVEAISGGSRMRIRRDNGWPVGDIGLEFDLIDTAGNEA